jgi:uncharacterized protein
MYFNVAQLLKENSGSRRSFQADEMRAPEGGAPAGHIAGTIRLLRTDRGVWVGAELESQVTCCCSRCLTDYEQPICMDIEEEYLPLVDIDSGAKLDLAEIGEENFLIDQNHILDLAEAVRQYSALNTPMKPVCGENCEGLCTTCGANRNETPCTCENTLVDSQWAPLLELASAWDKSN